MIAYILNHTPDLDQWSDTTIAMGTLIYFGVALIALSMIIEWIGKRR